MRNKRQQNAKFIHRHVDHKSSIFLKRRLTNFSKQPLESGDFGCLYEIRFLSIHVQYRKTEAPKISNSNFPDLFSISPCFLEATDIKGLVNEPKGNAFEHTCHLKTLSEGCSIYHATFTEEKRVGFKRDCKQSNRT